MVLYEYGITSEDRNVKRRQIYTISFLFLVNVKDILEQRLSSYVRHKNG